MSGESVRVVGSNFVPAPRGEPVAIRLDGSPDTKTSPVRADGSFTIDIPVTHAPALIQARRPMRKNMCRNKSYIAGVYQCLWGTFETTGADLLGVLQ